ncbi:molybdopterin molybdotransferase MoeA [Desulfovibrionales bacterium]
MVRDFFKLVSVAEFLAHLAKFPPLASEPVPLEQSLGRVVAQTLLSAEQLPAFGRSTVDGYAVRAADTFGCSESELALLHITGEVPMGASPGPEPVRPGTAVRLWTGGALPAKADAAVMLEYTQQLDEHTIGVFRPVAPGENCIRAGEDVESGACVLSAGHHVRPQDMGVLAGLGIGEIMAHQRPKVALLATGDELVPYRQAPQAGQIRDMNSVMLAGLVRQAGAEPQCYGIGPDNFSRLSALCATALDAADVVLLSGGTSVGQRDFTRDVFAALGAEIVVHGVAIKPGKPTILARLGNKALFGLPGHVASAMITFMLFVRPLLRALSGLHCTHGLRTVRARTEYPMPSSMGREDYCCVQLVPQAGQALPLARPVLGKSGLLTPLVRAQGILPIGRDVEGLDRGVETDVLLFPE